MKTATAPSPFSRAVDSDPVPERFLPGDGAATPARPAHLEGQNPGFSPRRVRLSEEPLMALPQDDPRETAREAEERLARIRAEEQALEHRKSELLTFSKELDGFQAQVTKTLDRLRQLDLDLAADGVESRRTAALIGRTIESLRVQLDKVDRIHPEKWTKSRMKAELDHALDLLDDVENDSRSEIRRLAREIPALSAKASEGFLGRCWYWIRSAFAFLLPLLVFVAVAVILVLTALGIV